MELIYQIVYIFHRVTNNNCAQFSVKHFFSIDLEVGKSLQLDAFFLRILFRTANNSLDSVLIFTKALNTPLLISFEDKKETIFLFTCPSPLPPPGCGVQGKGAGCGVRRGAGCGVRGTSMRNGKNANLDTKANLNPNPSGNFFSNSLVTLLFSRTRSLSPVPRSPSPVPRLITVTFENNGSLYTRA